MLNHSEIKHFDKAQYEQKLNELNTYYNSKVTVANEESLFGGYSGILLFRLYYANFIEEVDDQLIEDLIDFLSKHQEKEVTQFTYSHGHTGLAWFLQHINKKEFVDLEPELFENFDQIVYDSAKYFFELENLDYMHGALGCIFYLSNRVSLSKRAKAMLIELLNLLHKKAIETDEAIYWQVAPHLLTQDEKGKKIIYNHLSHGQASVISILANCVKNGVFEAELMLKKSANFLINSREKSSGLIPYRIMNTDKDTKTHSGWCRGNAGMGLAILKAAEVLNNNQLKEEGIKIGLKSLDFIEANDTMPKDPAICHGRAGLSQMYKRYYMLTGVEAFNIASVNWLNLTMELATFKDGICGFKTWDGHNQCWIKDPGLLTGSAGVGLALLAAISDKSMDWDEVFLLG